MANKYTIREDYAKLNKVATTLIDGYIFKVGKVTETKEKMNLEIHGHVLEETSGSVQKTEKPKSTRKKKEELKEETVEEATEE
jgi:hypothetical protein